MNLTQTHIPGYWELILYALVLTFIFTHLLTRNWKS